MFPGPNRQEVLLGDLKAMEVHFPSSQVQLGRVQQRMEAVEVAMRKARQVRLHPSLELYCDLHEVGSRTQQGSEPLGDRG